MTTPRRRLIRPSSPPVAPSSAEHQRRLQKLQTQLQHERAVLARWMARLRRAFHTVEKSQRRISSLERRLAKQEQ